MRVLIFADDRGIPGGHAVQAARTASALLEAGLEVDFTQSAVGSLRGYDVLHGFNVPRKVLRDARRRGAAIVISPIWWAADYVLRGPPQPKFSPSKSVFPFRVAWSAARKGVYGTAKQLRSSMEEASLRFELADLLLPNSYLEARQLRLDTGVTTPMHVVPNGVDVEMFFPPCASETRTGVLCVARLEPHKNQLALIRALRATDISLTLVGREHPHHLDYATRCKQYASANIKIFGGVPESTLAALYREAAVHVLPSWFETTGLVSLEAAASGCAVVSTDRGFASEYFKDMALYCDPSSERSIRGAVQTALRLGPRPTLRNHILSRYTWSHTARETIVGYERALSNAA